MLQILIVVGWFLAVAMLVFLAVQAVRHRFARPGPKSATKKAELFKKRRPSDESHRELAHPAAAPAAHPVHQAHQAHHDYRRFMTIFGFLALFLWEAYWLSEISDRFKWSANPFQLPYFFLLVVLVGIPLAVYLMSRRIMRRSAPSS